MLDRAVPLDQAIRSILELIVWLAWGSLLSCVGAATHKAWTEQLRRLAALASASRMAIWYPIAIGSMIAVGGL